MDWAMFGGGLYGERRSKEEKKRRKRLEFGDGVCWRLEAGWRNRGSDDCGAAGEVRTALGMKWIFSEWTLLIIIFDILFLHHLMIYVDSFILPICQHDMICCMHITHGVNLGSTYAPSHVSFGGCPNTDPLLEPLPFQSDLQKYRDMPCKCRIPMVCQSVKMASLRQ